MAKADLEAIGEGFDSLFAYLCETIGARYPRYGGVFGKLMNQKCQDKFFEGSIEQKKDSVFELLSLLHCNAAYGLSSLGLAGAAGRMTNINFGGSLSEITFIDTSVTGMFERRTKIES